MKVAHLRMVFAFFGFVLIGASSGAIAVILPNLSEYYAVDKSVVGLIFLAGASGYFLSAFISSMLLERLGSRRFLMLGAAMFLIGTLTLWIKPPFSIMLATRLFLGFGVAIIETGLNAFVVTLPRSTSLLNSLHAFYGAGALIGPVVAAALLAMDGQQWNSVFLVWSVLSLPLLLGFALVLPRHNPAGAQGHADESAQKVGKESAPIPSGDDVSTSTMPSTGKGRENILLATIKLPLVWWATLFLLFYVGIEVSLGDWSYTFLVEGQRQQELLSSWIVSGYWLGLTLGRFTLARLAERFKVGNQGLISLCIGGIFIGVLLIWLVPFAPVAALGFCFVGFSLGPVYPTTVAYLPQLVPGRFVSSAIGFLVSVSILGIAAFPWLAGILAQHVGIWSLLPYILCIAVLMLLFWWLIAGSTKRAKEALI